MERGRFFIVKWAQPFFLSATGRFELHIVADNFIDRRVIAHVCDIFISYATAHDLTSLASHADAGM